MYGSFRPRLTPAIADIRRAVREVLPADGTVLVGLSGGADSLALAAATSFEAKRCGVGAGVVIVDHGLQDASDRVAARAAEQAHALGLFPIFVERVTVSATIRAECGTEAAARTARYHVFERILDETGAQSVLLAHTRDDQAETVLLGLVRGAGARSLSGMAPRRGQYVRPLLDISRAMTRQFCVDSGVVPWDDPHNIDLSFARVRVRRNVLPFLEAELGPGVSEALARTAEQLREDSEFFDQQVEAISEKICAPLENVGVGGEKGVAEEKEGVSLNVHTLATYPAALRNRIIRHVAQKTFGVSLTREHTLQIVALVTNWHGQKTLNVPKITVSRCDGFLIFQLQRTSSQAMERGNRVGLTQTVEPPGRASVD